MSDQTKRIKIERNLSGLEDWLVGFGVVVQTRDGLQVPVTSINAGNLPFDETKDLAEKMEDVDEVLRLFDLYEQEFIFIEENSDAILAIPGQLAEMQDIQADITAMYNVFIQGALSVRCNPILVEDFLIPDNIDLALHGDVTLEEGVNIVYGENSNLCIISF